MLWNCGNVLDLAIELFEETLEGGGSSINWAKELRIATVLGLEQAEDSGFFCRENAEQRCTAWHVDGFRNKYATIVALPTPTQFLINHGKFSDWNLTECWNSGINSAVEAELNSGQASIYSPEPGEAVTFLNHVSIHRGNPIDTDNHMVLRFQHTELPPNAVPINF